MCYEHEENSKTVRMEIINIHISVCMIYGVQSCVKTVVDQRITPGNVVQEKFSSAKTKETNQLSLYILRSLFARSQEGKKGANRSMGYELLFNPYGKARISSNSSYGNSTRSSSPKISSGCEDINQASEENEY